MMSNEQRVAETIAADLGITVVVSNLTKNFNVVFVDGVPVMRAGILAPALKSLTVIVSAGLDSRDRGVWVRYEYSYELKDGGRNGFNVEKMI